MAHFKRLENYFRKFVDTSIYKKLIAHVVHLTMKVLSESVSVPESRYPLLNSRGRPGVSCAQVESFRAPKPAVLFDRPRDLCFLLKVRGASHSLYGF